jgi:glycerophosphoryl diester phosphodiesterase
VFSPIQIQPPVIAHRGASGYAPENTLVAFTKAAQLGIKWVEFDVMLASCGTPIIFHDDSLQRTTGKKGDVIQHSYPALQSLDAGSWFDLVFSGEKIPSLEQAMIWLKENNMCANIEIKPHHGQEELTVQLATPIINRYFPQPNPSILFSSFSIESLRVLRSCLPAANLGLLMHEWDKNWHDLCQELSCVSVNVNEAIMTRERAREFKSAGLQILCYTVNDPRRANELYAMGVDAVFSDIPDVILYAHKHTQQLHT